RHVYFPTYSNTLKEIGKFLGCQWSNPAASGIQSIVWREMWEQTCDPTIKDELITYNKEDCVALKRACDFLASIEAVKTDGETQQGTVPSIIQTSELPKPSQKWPVYGRPTFVLNDLQRASECAYFDYQRERVYLRTDKRFKQINKRAKEPRSPFTPN